MCFRWGGLFTCEEVCYDRDIGKTREAFQEKVEGKMKLLLVDDEAHVREGICARISWAKLGITELKTAKNGCAGLELSREFKPDIVLTDVRMPRMDGIEMAFAIREELPDCCIIFMSGYSDKEYLKSAITLKAISYVEKPMDLDELSDAIAKAVQLQEEMKQKKQESEELADQLKKSMDAYKNELMLDLTKKSFGSWHREAEVYAAFPELFGKKHYFVCLIEILGYTNENSKGEINLQKKIVGKLEAGLEADGIAACIGRKDENLLLVYIGLNEMNSRKLEERQKEAADVLGKILEEDCFYILSAGSLAEDVLHIYQSYNDAAALLITAFYYGKNCRLVYGTLQNGVYALGDKELQQFAGLVKHEDFESAVDFVTGLVSRLRENPDSFIYEVKDFFARLLDLLFQVPKGLDDLGEDRENRENIRDSIREMKFLTQLEALVVEQLQSYFDSKVQAGQKLLISDKIKYYVSCHFREPDLSLATIAQKLELTSPYLCSTFKRETNTTLTNYIMEYRVEQAKKYLQEENCKVKEAALLTGYSDCNYFIKVFKKCEGITPAEYKKEITNLLFTGRNGDGYEENQ